MAKEFKDWVDEFVENGADAKDVTNWPENAGGSSTVVPNPTLVGDEPNLTGLEVDGAKYKVPQGGGNKLFTVQIRGRINDSDNYPISLTTQVETNELTNFDDLQTYLEKKGYIFYFSSGEGVGFILQATGICSNYAIIGIYVEYGTVKVICSDGDKRSLSTNELGITYLGE